MPQPDRHSQNEPIPGLVYWVRGDGFRTRAIYTTSGKWLLPHNGKEVEGVISFCPPTS